jgi:hypothetical protein
MAPLLVPLKAIDILYLSPFFLPGLRPSLHPLVTAREGLLFRPLTFAPPEGTGHLTKLR